MSTQEALSAVGEMIALADEGDKAHLFDLINQIMDTQENLLDDPNFVSIEDLDEDEECL